MEALTGTRFVDQARMRRFEQECERLRPLGQAFVLRRFSGQFNREDAEDAVSDVIIRLHEREQAGKGADNLRAAFFTSVRNQAIDVLRARGARPNEVALEAAATAASEEGEPADRAESREEAAVLGEALARMRDNYREALVLRFGVGLTVPEIAEHKGISLPAAKKLILRATKQVKDKLLTVTSDEHCAEMREFARRSLFEKYANELATAEEAALVRKHLDHCGHCKAFLVNLHHGLHEVATGALLATGAAGQLSGKASVMDHVSSWVSGVGDSSNAGVEKVRLAAFKAGNAVGGADAGVGGALAGTGQKIAAVCGAGAAAATCVAAGVVGPGVGVVGDKPQGEEQPAKVQPAPEAAPVEAKAPVESAAPATETEQVVASPQEVRQKEFGLEASTSSKPTSGGEFGGGSGGSGGGGSGGGGGGSGGGGEFGTP